MSKDSTAVGAAVFAYIAEHTTPEDPFLRELRTAAAAAGLPEIHIAPEQAALLQLLLRLRGARQVIEIGTLGGYSAIAMARALPNAGRVRTLELEPKHAEFARAWIAKSDVKDRIEVLVGDARSLLPMMAAGCADAVFIDADKTAYVDYLRESLRLLRQGGLLLADNVLAGGEVAKKGKPTAKAQALMAFNDAVTAATNLRSIIVPLGDGTLVALKE